MHDESRGWICIVAGSGGLLLLMFITLQLRAMRRRAPDKPYRNGYGTYLTPGQSLRRLPVIALICVALIGLGLWQLHGA